jgi:DNA-binding transcriptional ArsR family regulator
LAQLPKGEASIKDLALVLGISGPALTKHLHMLERAGLITRSRDANAVLAGFLPNRLENYANGWKVIGNSGRTASTAWTST